MAVDFEQKVIMDSSDFVLLADYVPGIIQEIRYYSSYNFVGERIDGYEEPCALLTKEAARALKKVSNEVNVWGYRLKIFDTYRPARAVRNFRVFDPLPRRLPFSRITPSCSQTSSCVFTVSASQEINFSSLIQPRKFRHTAST